MRKVIVIGGGASGMMAAIAAAREGAAVTLLEKMEKPGKKLLVTGNGRCNLTNRNETRADAYRGGERSFWKGVLEQFPVKDTLDFFEELGLLTKDREGYVYPYTDQAASVLGILLQELKRLGVKVKCSEQVTSIEKKEGGFQVHTAAWHYEADRVILCAGGKAAPHTGSDGSGYALAKDMGHRMTPVLPALVPLKIEENIVRMLSGTRSKVELTLEIEGEMKVTEPGELQWTDYGVSGIVVFQISRFVSAALAEKKKIRIHVDLMPDYAIQDLVTLFERRRQRCPKETLDEMLCGILPKKAIGAFIKLLKRKASDQVQMEDLNRLAFLLKDFTLTVVGTKSFDAAQVCAGGVRLEEVKGITLESKKVPGLYLAGELLDVDGICGGYNLQWAWSSGFVAGKHAGKGDV